MAYRINSWALAMNYLSTDLSLVQNRSRAVVTSPWALHVYLRALSSIDPLWKDPIHKALGYCLYSLLPILVELGFCSLLCSM